MLATLEITHFNKGNFFLSFGDIESIDPPSITKGYLSLENFSNSFDLPIKPAYERWKSIEGFFFPESMEFLKSIQKTHSFTRNPFEVVEQGVCQKHIAPTLEEESYIHLTVIPKPASSEISVNTSKENEDLQLRRRKSPMASLFP